MSEGGFEDWVSVVSGFVEERAVLQGYRGDGFLRAFIISLISAISVDILSNSDSLDFRVTNLLGHLVHFFQPCLVPGEELCYLKILTFTLSLPPCFNLVEVARPMLLTDIVTRIFMMVRSAVGTIFPNMNQIR